MKSARESSRDPPTTIRFDRIEVDLRARKISRNGRRVRLAEKPFQVLAALLERPGDLVSRDELKNRLWNRDTFVQFENNLNTAVATLREALGDSARSARYVETVPRLGYRFVGAIESSPTAPRSRWDARARSLPAAIGAAGLVAAFLWSNAGGPLSTQRPSEHGPPGPSGYADGVYLLERDGAGDLERAIAILEDAISEHPEHAPSQAALAEAWLRSALRSSASREEAFRESERRSRRALQLDSTLSAPHRTLAELSLHRDWDFSAAARESGQALAAEPGDARNHLVQAVVSAAAGRGDEAIAAASRAISLDPGSHRVRADLAFYLLAYGAPAEAAAESRRVLALAPDFAPALDFLLVANERLGRLGEARDAALRLMQLGRADPDPIRSVERSAPAEAVRRYRSWQVRSVEDRAARERWPPTTVASIYASAGDLDKAFEWLERAYEARDAGLALIAAYPDLAAVRNDPRYGSLARRIGIPLVSGKTGRKPRNAVILSRAGLRSRACRIEGP